MSAPANDVVIGTVLGGYRLVKKIGQGGMGEVYLAEHTRIVRRAAVKLLRRTLSAEPELVQRFFAEARAASMIRHPGIVEVLDCDVHTDGTAFIVMEYLEGGSLREHLRRRGTLVGNCSDLATVGAQIANAMAAAHAHGIIHRDLKPDNVLLTAGATQQRAPRVKLLDFGIAKLLSTEASPTETRTGTVLGTPRYMSPEQCRGQRDLGPASDIYSLGCMLFEMACGRSPFTQDSVAELMAAHLEKQPPIPSHVEPRVPAALDALVLQMLSKDPAQRPTQMGEVETRLNDIGRAFDASAPTVPDAAQKTELSAHGPGQLAPTDVRPQTAGAYGRSSPRQMTLSTWLSSRSARLVLPSMFVTMVIGASALYYTWTQRQVRSMRAALESRLTLAGEVPTPAACATSDAGSLRRLLKAAALLLPEAGPADPAGALSQLADSEAGTAETWAMLARGRLAAADNAAALEAARRATALCPAYAAAHYLAGKAAHRLGRLDVAEAEYRQSLSGHENFVMPRFNLALLQLKRGEAATAVTTLSEVIERRPDAQAFLVRGQARLDTGDLAGAVSDLTQATQRDPQSGDGWSLLGTARARQGAYEEATAAFCRAKALGVAAVAQNCR